MKRRQDGFVSIVVAMAIMIFITLIALGFAFLARQNQSQNQNRILSTQAFYAAESGVNDAVKYLKDTLANTGSLPANQNTCNAAGIAPGFTSTIGSSNNEIKYTCVLYNTSPTSLEYTISNKDSRTVRLQSETGALRSVTISWQDSQGSQQFANNNQHFLPQASFTTDPANFGDGNNLATSTGILRATFIPVSPSMSRDDLTTKAQTLFLYPRAGAAGAVNNQPYLTSNSISDTNQGVYVDGNCNNAKTPRFCSVTITNLNGPVTGALSTYYLRLRSIYRASNVTITGVTTSGQPASLINEQAVVDSTGKAVNVLRRIQVRVPLAVATKRPEFAIETIDSLCKRLQVWPGGASVDAPAGGGAIPAACQP